MIQPPAAWSEALPSELNFWDGWFRMKGGDWPVDYERRMNPEQPLEAWVARNLREVGGDKVLDVGAGPISFLGYVLDGKRISLTACDALATEFREMAERHGTKPPVETLKAYAENLRAVFPPNWFDITHVRNALDHAFDPLAAIRQMIEVTRPGGRVLLLHAINEAENENYTGLHQWNFDHAEGRAILWNKGARHDLTALFGARAEVDKQYVRMTIDRPR